MTIFGVQCLHAEVGNKEASEGVSVGRFFYPVSFSMLSKLTRVHNSYMPGAAGQTLGSLQACFSWKRQTTLCL